MDDGAVLRGAVRYRRERTDGTVVDRRWQPNLVVRGCLDLVGALLCEDSDADGLRWLAVGAGDPAWDAGAPNPDPSRVALTAETARVALVPRRSLEVDIERGRVLVTARFPRGAVTGPIREVGLFGGADASVLPGSGRLVNHRVEPVVDHDEDDALHIEVELVLAEGLGAGARAVVARLLGRVPGARGITHVALGTDGRAGAAMRAEQWRRPVGAGRCRYDDRSASVVVTVRTEPGEALVGWPAQDDDDPTPRRIREVGVLGGVDEDGDSDAALLARDPVDGPRPDDPRPFEHTARLVLSARTDVRVPPLDGKTLAEAIALLHPALVLGAVRERNAGNITAGTVVEQLPEAGAEVNESTRVDLVVARLRTTRVPDVIGLDKARARRLLRNRNLDVADDAPVEVDGTGPERDVVMTCDPAPGTPVPRDTVIRLGVAVPREADVPNVRGRTRLGAEFELRRAGFVADVDDETRPSGATAGTVVAQKPKAGTRAPIDETLHLFLATPVTVEVPRVVNRDVTAAVEAIGKAGEDAAGAAFTVAAPGLSVGSVTAADSPKPPGTVTRQDPAGGEHTPLHGAVALWVAAGATVEVPDLAGMQRRAAQGALAEVGLRVGLLSTRMTGGTANTVVGQYPEPGRRLRTGLPVDLVVSKASLVPAPNLVGLLLDAAKEALEGRGLRIGQIERATGAGVRGTVTDQSPEAGELVKAGAKVALDVEDGVPGVVGLAKEAAVAILEAIGLTVTMREVPSPATADTVVDQDPPALAEVPAHREVTIGVAVQDLVAVPRGVGLSPSDAGAALEASELIWRVVGFEVDPAADAAIAVGSVLRHAPAEGDEVVRGSEVSLWLREAAVVPLLVPNVVGLSLHEALVALQAAGFSVVVGPTMPSDVVALDHVAAQMPPGDTEALPDRPVEVRVAVQGAVAPPDVRRLLIAAAMAAIRAVGLEPVLDDSTGITDLDDWVPWGRVVFDQNPSSTVLVEPGSSVTLLIGAAMPSFVGGDVGPVHDFAARFNLSLSIAYEESVVWDPGLVTLQSLGPGEPIVPGMPFSVNVSTPPGEIVDGTDLIVVDPGRTGILRPDPFRPGRFDRIGPVFRPGGGIG